MSLATYSPSPRCLSLSPLRTDTSRCHQACSSSGRSLAGTCRSTRSSARRWCSHRHRHPCRRSNRLHGNRLFSTRGSSAGPCRRWQHEHVGGVRVSSAFGRRLGLDSPCFRPRPGSRPARALGPSGIWAEDIRCVCHRAEWRAPEADGRTRRTRRRRAHGIPSGHGRPISRDSRDRRP